jgi:hypothetical protein
VVSPMSLLFGSRCKLWCKLTRRSHFGTQRFSTIDSYHGRASCNCHAMAAIMTAEKECSAAGRTKHVDVKYRFIQESIKMGEIRVR